MSTTVSRSPESVRRRRSGSRRARPAHRAGRHVAGHAVGARLGAALPDDVGRARRRVHRHRRGGEGQVAGEEFVEQHAEAVHVAGRRDGRPGALLGAGVGGREQALLGAREQPRQAHLVGLENLGDAEVQQLDARSAAVVHDEEVGGLEVAVDDEPLVGVLHRLADLLEEPQAVGHARGGGGRSTRRWARRPRTPSRRTAARRRLRRRRAGARCRGGRGPRAGAAPAGSGAARRRCRGRAGRS